MICAEILIKKTIDSMITFIRDDYNGSPDKTETLLYNIFSGVNMDDYNFFDQAVSLIMADATKPRHVQTRLMFDVDRVSVPTIHITMPSEEPIDNSVGFDPDISDNGMLTYSRRYRSVYGVIITSDNKLEVMILYYMLQSLMICLVDTLILSGLENPVIRGADIKLMTDVAPQGLATKSLSIEVTYDKTVKVGSEMLVQIRNLVFKGNIL